MSQLDRSDPWGLAVSTGTDGGEAQRVGRYALLQRLDVGGMAEIFLARQDGAAGFKKTVVIKRILPQFAADPRFVEMFLAEAHLIAQLSHQNIVQVLELGEADGVYFIALEFIDGITLHRLAARAWRHQRPLPMELVCGAIADAALGLHHAHCAVGSDGAPLGLVHRDVTPDNLMIDRSGLTKVLDFGIAKPTNDDARPKTQTGEMKGKIPFVPPEQLIGDTLDARTDVYTLGVGLYWLLTGRRPITGNNELELMNAIMKARPAAPSSHNASIPRELDELILSMLEKDRRLRPQSAEEVHDALAFALAARRRITGPFVDSIMGLAAAMDDDRPPKSLDGALASRPATSSFRMIGDESLAAVRDGLGVDEFDISDSDPIAANDTAVSQSPVVPAPVDSLMGGVTQSQSAGLPTSSTIDGRPINDDDASTLQTVAPPFADTADVHEVDNDGYGDHDDDDDVDAPTQANTIPSQVAASGRHSTNRSADAEPTLALAAPDDEAPPTRDKGPMLLAAMAAVALIVIAVATIRSMSDATLEAPVAADVVASVEGVATVPDNPAADAGVVVAIVADDTPIIDDAVNVVADNTDDSAVVDHDDGADAVTVVKKVKPDIARRTITVSGPPSVRWYAEHRPLTVVDGKAQIPPTCRSVVAVDGVRSVRTEVAIPGSGVIDYSALPKGKLTIRAKPFADVSLGKDALGVTPFPTMTVVAGSYDIVLVHEGRQERRTVTVKPGEDTRVAVDFTVP